MVLYSCKICNFSSKIKTHYNRHLNTKKHANKIELENKKNEEMTLKSQKEPKRAKKEPKRASKEPKRASNINKFECIYCYQTFSTYSNKRRHELHRCSEMPYMKKEIIKLEREKKKLEKDKEKLENKVDKLTDRIGNTTNIQNNNTNNIKINSYGEEDLSHITEAFKTSLLSGPYGAIPKMIEAVHFNDEKPENKNILLPNTNKNIIKIKKGDKWVHKNKEMIILDMIDSKYLMLDDHFNLIVNGDKLSKYTKDIFKKFRDKYDDGDKELINNIKGDCEMVMLDSR